MVRVNNTLVCGAGFFRFSWPPTHYRVSDSEFLKMALLKYFRKIEPSIDEQVESILPKPHGSLSLMMPSSSIAAANCKVRKIMKSDKE